MTAYSQIFAALAAETVLLLTALAVLAYDLGWARRQESRPRNGACGRLTLVGLVLALIPLLQGIGSRCEFTVLGGALVADGLTFLFKSVVLGLTLLVVVLSLNQDVGRHVGEYYATILFGAMGMMVLLASEELITIFVALELLSLCLYILTATQKQSLRSQEAALKYFMFGAISSGFLLFGLSYLVGLTGTTYLREMATANVQQPALLNIGLLFVLVGFGFKIAVVPFHLWAPDAYEGAPTPVTAYIATGSKVASFIVLLRVLMTGLPAFVGNVRWQEFAAGWGLLLAVMAVLSMVIGNVVAITQQNLKRLLAYSSIAHAGYILIGMIAASAMGATSVLYYIIIYALTNLGAFGVVVALSHQAGGEDLRHFNGMARRAPFLSLCMLIFVLSLAGVPPLAGFFGKFYLFAAAVEHDPQQFGLLWLVIVGIFMSAVSLYYYLIVLKHFYVVEPIDRTPVRTPRYLQVTLGMVAGGVILLGVFPEPLLALLKQLVSRL